MIIDSSSYNMSRQTDLHLHTFSQNPQVVNLTRSVWWTKYHYQLNTIKERRILSLFLFIILYFIQLLMILSTLPFFFLTYYTLLKYHIINDIYREDLFSKFYVYFSDCTFYVFNKIYTNYFEPESIPKITFMVPYIKLVN